MGFFRNRLPDWDAKRPPRNYKSGLRPRASASWIDPRNDRDLIAVVPAHLMRIRPLRNQRSKRIGCALMVASALLIVMIAAQFLRAHAMGVL